MSFDAFMDVLKAHTHCIERWRQGCSWCSYVIEQQEYPQLGLQLQILIMGWELRLLTDGTWQASYVARMHNLTHMIILLQEILLGPYWQCAGMWLDEIPGRAWHWIDTTTLCFACMGQTIMCCRVDSHENAEVLKPEIAIYELHVSIPWMGSILVEVCYTQELLADVADRYVYS